MPTERAIVKIFLSSPGDLETQREMIAKRLHSLSRMFDKRNIALEVITGATASPRMGRPQEQINVISDCDIYVGMIWLRFGTPTGGTDQRTGRLFLSGTEEEFRLAYDGWRKTGRPEILFYFCNRAPDRLGDINPDQFARVVSFKESFNATGANPGLVRNYEIPEDLETLVVSDVLGAVETISSNWTNTRKQALDVGQFGLLDFFIPFSSSQREARKRESIDGSYGNLWIVAHSGFSFLGRIGARYRPQVIRFLERGGRIRVALISPWSEMGLALAISGSEDDSLFNYRDRSRDEICTTIEQSRWHLVKYKDSIEGYLELSNRFKNQIELRITSGHMPATVLITDLDAYMEPYLLADLPKRRDLMLASFEVRFSSTSYMQENLHDYAEFVFSNAMTFERFTATEEESKDSFWRSFSMHGGMQP
jgi:hypothetical protein